MLCFERLRRSVQHRLERRRRLACAAPPFTCGVRLAGAGAGACLCVAGVPVTESGAGPAPDCESVEAVGPGVVPDDGVAEPTRTVPADPLAVLPPPTWPVPVELVAWLPLPSPTWVGEPTVPPPTGVPVTPAVCPTVMPPPSAGVPSGVAAVAVGPALAPPICTVPTDGSVELPPPAWTVPIESETLFVPAPSTPFEPPRVTDESSIGTVRTPAGPTVSAPSWPVPIESTRELPAFGLAPDQPREARPGLRPGTHLRRLEAQQRACGRVAAAELHGGERSLRGVRALAGDGDRRRDVGTRCLRAGRGCGSAVGRARLHGSRRLLGVVRVTAPPAVVTVTSGELPVDPA